MPIVAHIVLPQVTREQYDALRTAADWVELPPAGRLAHFAWWEGADCHNLDAWESAGALEMFNTERLEPALAQAGITCEPVLTLHEPHEVRLPRATVVIPTMRQVDLRDDADVIRRAYADLARRDLAAVLDAFDNRIRWYSPDSVPTGGTFVGRQQVAGYFSALADVFAELHVEPEAFIAQGDTVIVQGTHRGRTRGGAPFTLPFVHVWRVAGGKAISFAEHFDTARLNTVLTAVPEPAG